MRPLIADIDPAAAAALDLRRDGGISGTTAVRDDARRRQDLHTMTDRGDGLFRLGEVTDDVQHLLVQPEIFRRPAAGKDEGVVGFGLHFGEGRVEREIVAALLAVGLIALEVVDRGAHLVAGLLVGTHRMDDMAHHLQRLEGDHDFVIFNVIADEHQELFRGHSSFLRVEINAKQLTTESQRTQRRPRNRNSRSCGTVSRPCHPTRPKVSSYLRVHGDLRSASVAGSGDPATTRVLCDSVVSFISASLPSSL